MENCSFCMHPSITYLGPGRFRDFDSDWSNGIPICPNCGGLGQAQEDEHFRALALKVKELRFSYCPPPPDQPPLPAERLETLENLIVAVRDIWNRYGKPEMRCFGREIAEGALDVTLEELQRVVRSVN